MGDLTENFNRSEFACKCGCGLDEIQLSVVELCQEIRDHFGAPVRITSACRCPAHNAAVGGTSASRHVECDAADIQVAGVDPEDVQGLCEVLVGDDGGLGRYDTFTHIDLRGWRARW